MTATLNHETGRLIAADWARTVARRMYRRPGELPRNATKTNVAWAIERSLHVLLRDRDWSLTREEDGRVLRLIIGQEEHSARIALSEPDAPWPYLVTESSFHTMWALLSDPGRSLGASIQPPQPKDIAKTLVEPTRSSQETDGSVILTRGNRQVQLFGWGANGYRIVNLSHNPFLRGNLSGDALYQVESVLGTPYGPALRGRQS